MLTAIGAGKMKDFCAMCALQDHVQRCLLGDKSGGGGGVISPRNITGKLRGKIRL
jgi:hypothetical protein